MEIFGIRLVGINSENIEKLLLTLAFIAAYVVVRLLINFLVRLLFGGRKNEKGRFWAHQVVNMALALTLVLGLLSIWVRDPARLTTALGLVTAGLAFALQKVITSFAGYFVILRSGVFSVGDRIMMGGVRGDVIALGFIQTTIMEMGQPPGESADAPSVWVRSRQFTGRIVIVTNDKVFEEAIFNYSHDFPYLWEEMTIPVNYKDDRKRAEEIILEAAKHYTVEAGEMSQEALEKMREKYYLPEADLKPRVYYRITDNWLELTVRFVVRADEARSVKDRMSREIMGAFDEAGIGIASGTYDIVGLPPVKVEMINSAERGA
ncbi:MAG: mechanosensitive ion channel family protein [Acidobacteriota bacterium]|nr:mechanosensitive ion channel family protein [Acidobacteriota bacterium]